MPVDPDTGEILPTDPRPFSAWLFEQRDGATHAELTDALAALVSAVAETSKAGSITLKIKVAPAGKGGRTVTVADQVTTSLPELDRDTSVFFVNRETASLERSDPYQSQLPLQEVPRPAGQLKEA